jgi:hypothetical protein
VRAAERSGKRDVAREHYQQLIVMAGAGDGRRQEIAHARNYLAKP